MGRVACLEILFPDDAVRNLIRQGKVEQIYSVMQTSTQRGMQTMEHGLAELIRKQVVTSDAALAVSSRKDQLVGMLERSGVPLSSGALDGPVSDGSGLRLAGSG
jgi:twitching motility protein PilT